MPNLYFFDRDLSWLAFNYRVLEEAAKESTPLLERVRFLSIYSSNLDEFYRVRVPALAALQKIKKGQDRSTLLTEIGEEVKQQMNRYGRILTEQVLPALHGRGIHFVYNNNGDTTQLPDVVRRFAREYFFTQVLAFLQPVHLSRVKDSFFPENDQLYLAVVTGGGEIYLLNIPSDALPRFYRVETGGTQYVLFIDDILRDHLDIVFPDLSVAGAYSIKITRDAELELEDEYEGDIAEKIEKKLAKRDAGLATRFLYQPGMPDEVLLLLIDCLGLRKASVIEGGRYHNLRDLSDFPVRDAALSYPPWPAVRMAYEDGSSLFRRIAEKDILLHTPYESYGPVLAFFNEASIDPSVEEIYVTLYRIAHDSRIAHALISAARNGKKVTVFVELKARFDEANNLAWAKQMKQAGVRIIYSIPGLKVHAKVALVKKRTGQRLVYYGLLATGNLNENTARFYTDHILLTGNHDIVREMELLFIFLSKRKDPRNAEAIPFRHLLVAQFNLQEKFLELMDREMAHARAGLPAAITIKLNNLEEEVMIGKLYEASQAGVAVILIVRSICRCIPGLPDLSAHIRVLRIVDRYLEHGRVFIFHNNGEEEIYLGSSDWMNRNLYRRIEVCFPLYEEALKKEVREMVRLQVSDTVAAVELTAEGQHKVPERGEDAVRSQEAIYRFLKGGD